MAKSMDEVAEDVARAARRAPESLAAARLVSTVRTALDEYRHQTAGPSDGVTTDSRLRRDTETGSMVHPGENPHFVFKDEVDGLVVLQELGDELRNYRSMAAEVMAYLCGAIVALRTQHDTRPIAIVDGSGLSPGTVYKLMEEHGVSPVKRAPTEEEAADNVDG